MARGKKALHPWVTAKHDSKGELFVQIGVSLLQSAEYGKLSAAAQKTYLAMCMEAKGKGNENFCFSVGTARRYHISESSFDRSKKELISKGFIKKTLCGKNTREKNQYIFSYDWKQSAELYKRR